MSGDKVVFGATVTLLDEDDKPVTLPDRRPDRGRRQDRRGSRYNSPIGRALIGRKVDEEVEVSVPAGDRYYLVSEDRVHLNRYRSLPRGRVTDALVAVIFVTAVLQLVVVVASAAMPYGFMPLDFVTGAWQPTRCAHWRRRSSRNSCMRACSSTLFNTIFMLVAGRYVERSIGPVGLIVTFVAGAYGGARRGWR